ncbi:MAG TPA: histidinol dehydrogenase, partial [Longimicrobiaceae bacterium]|nr:histidinol dehydrogenase [Longimicrobiaceae bacterium]
MSELKIRLLRSEPPFDALREAAAASATDDPALRETVARILRDVARRGDLAVVEYTRRFDDLEVAHAGELRVGADALAQAAEGLDPELLGALRRAAENIRGFHER